MSGVPEEVATCPRGHGPLRKGPEGRGVCVICGYEQPPDPVPAQEPDSKGNEVVRTSRRRGELKYPQQIKLQAVRDLEHGATKREVMRQLGCSFPTLQHWQEKYGTRIKHTNTLNVLREMRAEMIDERFNLDRRISTLETAITIVENEGKQEG